MKGSFFNIYVLFYLVLVPDRMYPAWPKRHFADNEDTRGELLTSWKSSIAFLESWTCMFWIWTKSTSDATLLRSSSSWTILPFNCSLPKCVCQSCHCRIPVFQDWIVNTKMYCIFSTHSLKKGEETQFTNMRCIYNPILAMHQLVKIMCSPWWARQRRLLLYLWLKCRTIK